MSNASPFKPVDPIVDELIGGRVVAYRPTFARAFGSAAVGILLSQFWYYSMMQTAHDRDGWFYAPQEQIEEEAGLSRCEQETARKHLRNAGILEESREGLPSRLYYRIDKGRAVEQLRLFLQKDVTEKAKREEKRQARNESRRQESAESADNDAEIPQTRPRVPRRQARASPAVKQAVSPQTITKTPLRNPKKSLIAAPAAPDDLSSLFSGEEQKEPEKRPEGWGAALSQSRKELTKPDFKARHGRVSCMADWEARAFEILAQKGGGG